MAVHGFLYLEQASSKLSKFLTSSFCSIITPFGSFVTTLMKHTRFHAATFHEAFITVQCYLITRLFMVLAPTKTKEKYQLKDVFSAKF